MSGVYGRSSLVIVIYLSLRDGLGNPAVYEVWQGILSQSVWMWAFAGTEAGTTGGQSWSAGSEVLGQPGDRPGGHGVPTPSLIH